MEFGLDFEFEAGACNTFNRNTAKPMEEEVFLCFSSTDAQVCKMYDFDSLIGH